MRGDRQRVGVVCRGRGHLFPIRLKERSRLALESLVRSPHDIGGRETGGVWEEVAVRERRSGEGAQEGEGNIGELVHWEMGPYLRGRALGSYPAFQSDIYTLDLPTTLTLVTHHLSIHNGHDSY